MKNRVINNQHNFFITIFIGFLLVLLVPISSFAAEKTNEATVVISGNTDTIEYDGRTKSVVGFTSNAPSGITVKLKENISAEVSGEDSGTYYMGLEEKDFVVSGKGYDKINVIVKDGWLKITPVTRKITVEIMVGGDGYVYDGYEHTTDSYEVHQLVNGFIYDKNSVRCIAEKEDYMARGTDAGFYKMNLSAEDFVNTNKNLTNVEFKIIDYGLTIMPIPWEVDIKIIGCQKTIDYNGEENELEGVYAEPVLDSSSYLLDSSSCLWVESFYHDKNNLVYNGSSRVSGTDAGKYFMGLKAEDFENANKNFEKVNFIIEDGYLEILPLDDVSVKVIGNNDSVMYDGQEHQVEGYTVQIENELYTENDFVFNGTAKATGVDVGTYGMNIKSDDFQNINKNFNNVQFEITDGTLDIMQKGLIHTHADKSKTKNIKESPTTADQFNLMFWIVVLLVTLITITICLRKNKSTVKS